MSEFEEEAMSLTLTKRHGARSSRVFFVILFMLLVGAALFAGGCAGMQAASGEPDRTYQTDLKGLVDATASTMKGLGLGIEEGASAEPDAAEYVIVAYKSSNLGGGGDNEDVRQSTIRAHIQKLERGTAIDLENASRSRGGGAAGVAGASVDGEYGTAGWFIKRIVQHLDELFQTVE